MPGAEWRYWVEKSMLVWLRGLICEEMDAGEGALQQHFCGLPRERYAVLDELKKETVHLLPQWVEGPAFPD
jgi:hypothetical protein